MKKYLLGLLCLPGMMFSQILTVSNGASISIENTASISLDGLSFVPSEAYVISEGSTVTLLTDAEEVNGNSSVSRVYEASTALSSFTGTLVFAYADDDLNGIDETKLVLETQSADGTWTAHSPTVKDATNNSLSYDFTDLEFTKITASSDDASLSVEAIAINDFVKVYPNPTTDKLVIVSKNLQKSILYNVSGQKVIESNRNELNVSKLPTGIYLLHTTNKQNQLSTFKIIKK
ncbi:T9SS type A sorting domain-containing protein [Flavobacteriaceae bacterium]|nr:T9SS type A sorting domain-containing protein [Flavobacteriaceae bacterium]